MGGQVITVHCWIRAAENLWIIQEQLLHPETVTVWCVFTDNFIIGLYFLQLTGNRIYTYAITGKRYRDMLRDFLISQLRQCGCHRDIFIIGSFTDHRGKQLLRQHCTDVWVIQLTFSNRMTSLFAGYHPQWLLVVRFPEGQYLLWIPRICQQEDIVRSHVLETQENSLRSTVENMVLRLEHIIGNKGGQIEQF